VSKDRRIAVAAEDSVGLDGQVSEHFGRCSAYVVIETQAGEIVDTRVVANPYADRHSPGSVPSFIRELGANAIIAGGMGPRAVGFFEQFGIDVATGASGRVRDAVGAYLRGELGSVAACSGNHPQSCGGGHV
jgi:predicted Fe-Mo cluster-binding NifX family protein